MTTTREAKLAAKEAIECNPDCIMCMRFARQHRSAESIAAASGLTVDRVKRVLAWGVSREAIVVDSDGGYSFTGKPSRPWGEP